jgi:hypothetical protein
LQLRGTDRLGRIGLQHLAGHEEVEEAPQRREVLFDGRRGAIVFFDTGSDMDRLNIG